jgi:hypothetical protein
MASVPSSIIKWIISFLSDRMQATIFLGKLSTLMKINWSIVQGSGIGPTYIHQFACDLKSIDSLIYLLKYADDSTLICPEKSVVPVEDEMANLVRWSTENKISN